MIHQEITNLHPNYIIVALLAIWATPVIAASEEELLMSKVMPAEYHRIDVISILKEVASQTGFLLNVEDVPASSSGGNLKSSKIDYIVKGETLREALDALMKKTGAFTWERDGHTINIIATGLKKDNPFDQKVEKISFKGTRTEFLQKMNMKAPSLEAFEVSGLIHSDDDEAVISFETKETLPLRKVFNRFSWEGRLNWRAEVRDAQPPTTGPIVNTPTTISGIRVATRTKVIFTPMPSIDPLLAPVPSGLFKNASLVVLLLDLRSIKGIGISLEDVRGEGAIESTKVSLDAAERDVREFLDALMKKIGAFTWQRDGNTINIISIALKKDNPFDQKVEKFRFKGARVEFLMEMNRKVPSLEAFEAGIVGHSSDTEAVISFETKETLPLRDVFNRFAWEGGLNWRAEVRTPQSPTTGPVVNTPTTISGIRVAARTMVMFTPMPPH